MSWRVPCLGNATGSPLSFLKEPDRIGKLGNLRQLFEVELRSAYDCEQKLVRMGIPTMIESAGSAELTA